LRRICLKLTGFKRNNEYFRCVYTKPRGKGEVVRLERSSENFQVFVTESSNLLV
jgi:hypothetical protein